MKALARTLLAALVGAVFLLAVPVVAGGPGAATTAPISVKSAPTTDVNAPLHEAQRAADIAEIKLDVLNVQRDNFGILITGITGFFSVLITLLVIFFGFKTEKAAVSAAKAGIREDKDAITKIRDEANTTLAEIHATKAQADETLKAMNPNAPPTDAASKQAITGRAAEADKKPRNEHNAADYRALIMRDAENGNWASMADRAGSMDYVFTASDEDAAWAQFALGVALDRLSKHDEVIPVCDVMIARFDKHEDPAIQEAVAGAIVNKGFTLGQLGKHDEAIAAYDALIARFDTPTEPAIQELVAAAMVYKGVALGQLGKHVEAIAAYDALIARYGESDHPKIQVVVELGRSNRALFVNAKLDKG